MKIEFKEKQNFSHTLIQRIDNTHNDRIFYTSLLPLYYIQWLPFLYVTQCFIYVWYIEYQWVKIIVYLLIN